MLNAGMKKWSMISSNYSLQENEQPDPKGRNIKARDGAKRNPWKDGHSLNQPCKGAISVHLLRPFRAGLEVNEFPGITLRSIPGCYITTLRVWLFIFLEG